MRYFIYLQYQDFATPSLKGEVARGSEEEFQGSESLSQYAIEHRKKWEERCSY